MFLKYEIDRVSEYAWNGCGYGCGLGMKLQDENRHTTYLSKS